MIQNSRSPVVKSRISSSSGRTMSVEKRSFAWTGTMSSLLYLTMRASSLAAIRSGAASRTAKRSRTTNQRLRSAFGDRDGMSVSPLLGNIVSLRISVFKQTDSGLHEQHESGEESGEHEWNEGRSYTQLRRDSGERGDHSDSPARTSSPFSNPWAPNASFRLR